MWKVLLNNEEEFHAHELEYYRQYIYSPAIKPPTHYPCLFIGYGYEEYSYIYLEEFFDVDIKCVTIWKEKGSPLSYRRDLFDPTKWKFD
jgi:hypothetical protein